MNLYKAIISFRFRDDVKVEFEARTDSEAAAIVDDHALRSDEGVQSKRLYKIGVRIK